LVDNNKYIEMHGQQNIRKKQVLLSDTPYKKLDLNELHLLSRTQRGLF